MVRRKSPVVEGLEERALLSSVSYSLTTNQSVYQVGQPIEMTFTETNTGKQAVRVDVSPTDFTISQNDATIWQSDPSDDDQPPKTETLLPGKSVSQTAKWDGTYNYYFGGLVGSSLGSPINIFGAFVVSNPNAPSGLNATFQITDPISYSLTTDKSAYQLDEPVHLTYTEVNTSGQPIIVMPDEPGGFRITHNGAAVLIDVIPLDIPAGPETIPAGKTYTDSQTWDGIPMSGPYTIGNLTGTFVVGYGPVRDGTQLTTTVQISPPTSNNLVTSVTTNQLDYDAGQPVNLTFTETNDGDQAVVVITGSPKFEVIQNETTIWGPFYAGAPVTTQPTWSTLQPGQSYSQTAAWNGLPTTGPLSSLAAPMTVSNDFDPNADTATFQYVAPPTDVLNTSLTTDQSVYQLGQPIQLKFTETNTGNQPIAVLTGPNAFEITSNGTSVWESTDTDELSSSASWETLQPGQSYTQTITWDGFDGYSVTSPEGTGTFAVSDLLDPTESSASFQILSTPHPTQPVPGRTPIAVTLSTDQDTYKSGQNVAISLVLKNVSASKVAIKPSRSADKLSVLHGSTVVFESARKFRAVTSETLKPGHALRITNMWSGKANQLGVKKLTPGIYTIEVDDDGYLASTTVEIVSRHKR